MRFPDALKRGSTARPGMRGQELRGTAGSGPVAPASRGTIARVDGRRARAQPFEMTARP